MRDILRWALHWLSVVFDENMDVEVADHASYTVAVTDHAAYTVAATDRTRGT